MKHRILIGVALSGFVGVASAQGMPADEDGELFSMLDKDGNSEISQQEMSNIRQVIAQRAFNVVDESGDGSISKEEYLLNKREQALKEFGQLDGDGNGSLNMDEVTADSSGQSASGSDRQSQGTEMKSGNAGKRQSSEDTPAMSGEMEQRQETMTEPMEDDAANTGDGSQGNSASANTGSEQSMGLMATRMMMQLDADRDGKVTKKEWQRATSGNSQGASSSNGGMNSNDEAGASSEGNATN